MRPYTANRVRTRGYAIDEAATPLVCVRCGACDCEPCGEGKCVDVDEDPCLPECVRSPFHWRVCEGLHAPIHRFGYAYCQACSEVIGAPPR